MKPSKTFWRYCAFQVPGWIFVGVLTWWLQKIEWLSSFQAWGLFGLWFIKDFLLYPLLGSAYAPSNEKNKNPLIGKIGTVIDPLTPSGYIKVDGERWKAKLFNENDSECEQGSKVKIKEVSKFTLLVENLDGDQDSVPTSDRL
jgi:membrane-bound ClpP family serine protease